MAIAETVGSVFGLKVDGILPTQSQPFTSENNYYIHRALDLDPFNGENGALRQDTLTQILALGRFSKRLATIPGEPQVKDCLGGKIVAAIYLGQTAEFNPDAVIKIGDMVHITSRIQKIRPDKNILTIRTDCYLDNDVEVAGGVGVIMLKEVSNNSSADVPLSRVDGNGNGHTEISPEKDQITYPKTVAFASGIEDYNLVHLDWLAAQRAGFPDTIAHGMHAVAFGLKRCPYTVFGVIVERFRLPVLAGDSIRTIVGNPILDEEIRRKTASYKVLNQHNLVVNEGNYLLG